MQRISVISLSIFSAVYDIEPYSKGIQKLNSRRASTVPLIPKNVDLDLVEAGIAIKARIHYHKSSRKDNMYSPKSTKHLLNDSEFVNRCR